MRAAVVNSPDLLQTINELTEWISSLRKTCSKNTNILNYFHPGEYKGKRWSCCTARSLTEQVQTGSKIL